MHFSRRTAQLLHEDHVATIAVIESLEQMIASARRAPPSVDDPDLRRVLSSVATAIEGEIAHHFTFEETELFTLLEDNGDVGISAHLTSEHRAILPLGQTVARQARAGLENGFSGGDWPAFRNAAGELIERMFAHIQKEEMALLPILEDLLDPEADMTLATGYANITE
ncbi:MAG: hemerythrin domain-containing protein [Paracoccaceae bacterium]